MLFRIFFLLLSTWPPPLWAVKSNIFPEVLRIQHDFVDKSEMLRIFFDQNYTEIPSQPYYYITTPRQFAKSINMDMVHTFVAKKFDDQGNPVNPVDTEAYSIFKNMKIAEHESIISEHLARYIVLQLDLMAMAFEQASVQEVVTDLNSLLSIELSILPKLKNLADQFQLAPSDEEFIQKVEGKNLTLNELETSLCTLIRIVYHVYNNTPVILLVDEYDETAFNSYITSGNYATGMFKTINEMLTYAMVHGQAYLKFVLIQGLGTLAYALDDSLRAVAKHYPFLGIHPFTPFYGFTEPEVEELFTKHYIDDTDKQAIHRHYKGYVSASRRTVLYNPHSIINCLFDHRRHSPSLTFNPKSYVKESDWTGRIAKFLRNSQFLAKMYDLYKNGSLNYPVNKRHKPDALLELEKLREAKFNDSSSQHVDTLITECFEMGYLCHGPEEGSYVIPNDEMKDVIEEEFHKYNSTLY